MLDSRAYSSKSFKKEVDKQSYKYEYVLLLLSLVDHFKYGEKNMNKDVLPRHYQLIQEQHPDFIKALSELGRTVRQEGPLDEKTVELIQMVAAAVLRLEGAVHSHARRAMQAGASPEEIRHALIVITSTSGFPAVSSALSWVMDMTGEQDPSKG